MVRSVWFGLVLVLMLAVGLGGCGTPSDGSADKGNSFGVLGQGAAPQQTPEDEGAQQMPLIRVRVWADQRYRAQDERWEERFRRQLEAVNARVQEDFKVRFEAVEFRTWTRQNLETSLEAALLELEGKDDAEGVGRVVGLLGPLDDFSVDHSALGIARPLGAHMLVRGLMPLAEREYLADETFSLDDAAREAFVAERLAHKESTIFLHQWARSLGALQAVSRAGLMYPTYEGTTQAFESGNKQLMLLSLQWPDAHQRPASKEALHKEMRQTLSQSRHQAQWVAAEVTQMMALLSGGPDRTPLQKAEMATINQALGLLRSNQADKAWAALRPLQNARHSHPGVQSLACDIAAALGDPKLPTEDICAKAARLAPDSAWPLLRLGGAQLAREDFNGAVASLMQARDRLRVAPSASASWQLAELMASALLVTMTEEALTPLQANDRRVAGMRAWATVVRHRYGLPPRPNLAMDPIQEGAFIRMLEAQRRAIAKGDMPHVLEIQGALDKHFPQAPGTLAARCEVFTKLGRTKEAMAACQQAIKRYDACSTAHHLTAMLHIGNKAFKQARRHLSKAVDLDPDAPYHWHALAGVLRTSKDTKALKTLQERYQSRFQRPLPAAAP